jgi:2-amino-4-hydroxy-6-hydroxymethyldihydropteridine diphosphokinase
VRPWNDSLSCLTLDPPSLLNTPDAQSRRVFIALGSNQGDSVGILRETIERLKAFAEGPVQVSSFWKTEPVACPPGSPPFINAVVSFQARPAETPETLFNALQQIERDFGRRPKEVLNEPRPLDLDLIAFGDEIRRTQELTLPHPRAHERRFVLAPLNELAPDLVLPGQTRRVTELLQMLGPG